MKILYAVQATGNGHISRAIEIIPYLQKQGNLDILVSGSQSDIELPFPIKYRYKGLSFVFGENGGINYWKTFLKCNFRQLFKDIAKLNIKQYDLVISDFEPISAWSAKLNNIYSVGLSNQVATLYPSVPQPKLKDPLGIAVLKWYAPTKINYGFHFNKYSSKIIYTPIIRQTIRDLKPYDGDHYTVYLPAFSEESIVLLFSDPRFKDLKIEIFAKTYREWSYEDYEKKVFIKIKPIEQKSFIESLESCKGVLCNAGFGTCSEALFLNKKLLAIPMKAQYEQRCNAKVLKDIGVTVLKGIEKKKHISKIFDWINNGNVLPVDYPNNTEEIINTIFENYYMRLRAVRDFN